MPLSTLTEAFFQVIAEIVLQVVGYLTGRIIIPAFTLGVVLVEPGPRREFVRPGLGRVQRQPNGRLLMDADLAALIGLLFWVSVGVGIFLYQRYS